MKSSAYHVAQSSLYYSDQLLLWKQEPFVASCVALPVSTELYEKIIITYKPD